MITKPTPQEKVQAILDTVKPVAEYLQSIGKIQAFNDFTKDEICGLIRVAQEGVQNSLSKRGESAWSGGVIDDEIPFAPEVRG